MQASDVILKNIISLEKICYTLKKARIKSYNKIKGD